MGIRPEDLSKVSDLLYIPQQIAETHVDSQNQGWFHGSVQNGKDVWLCVHCGGTFGEKGNLARHVRIVHDKVHKTHELAKCISPQITMDTEKQMYLYL
jgi:hypothetical protein